jgi:hypothetical protein
VRGTGYSYVCEGLAAGAVAALTLHKLMEALRRAPLASADRAPPLRQRTVRRKDGLIAVIAGSDTPVQVLACFGVASRCGVLGGLRS